jgi:hypothetical protein
VLGFGGSLFASSADAVIKGKTASGCVLAFTGAGREIRLWMMPGSEKVIQNDQELTAAGSRQCWKPAIQESVKVTISHPES